MNENLPAGRVRFVGLIWQPDTELFSAELPITAADLKEIGEFSRENVLRWLTTPSFNGTRTPDFSQIVDFSATATISLPWGNKEHAWGFADAPLKAEQESK